MRRVWVVLLFSVGVAYGADVSKIKIEKIGEGIRVSVSTDAQEYTDAVLKNPARIIVDFKNTLCHLPRATASRYPPLVRIRASQYKVQPAPTTRMVMDLEHEISYSISRADKSIRIDLGTIGGSMVLVTPESSAPESSAHESPAPEAILPKPSESESPVTGPHAHKTQEPDSSPSKSGKSKLAQAKPAPSFFYNSRQKRDPFKPYLGSPSKDTLLDVSSAVIVGIMWSPSEKYALAEDGHGKAFILEEGDMVSGGTVCEIHKKEVVFLIRVFGGTRKISLKITPTKEKK